MGKMYDETDLTWSSVERYYKYDKVTWSIRKNGIPVYTLEDKNGKKIKINS
jgi:hypothetical protein